MMEYFGYKKYKKNKAEKERQEKAAEQEQKDGKVQEQAPAAAVVSTSPPPAPKPPTAAPVLDDEDERFLMRIISRPNADDGNEADDDDDAANRPALPPRVKTPDISWDSDDASVRHLKVKGKEGRDGDKASSGRSNKKLNRLSSIFRRKENNPQEVALTKANLDPNHLALPEPETDREKDDLSRVLDQLNMSARNNKAFTFSTESAELARKFTLVLKDLVNGVPTAAGDLQRLVEDKDGTIARAFEKLPKSMKKLVTQLPTKLSSTLAPELLAVAAEAQGVSKADAQAKGKSGMFKGAAKKLLVPKNLQDIVTKPGAVVGLLKGIMNALKLRWPAFIGTNVIWSVAVFLLLFVLWYCHKRGREVRLEKERSAASESMVEAGDRVEELPDDPALPAPPPRAGSSGGRTPIAAASRSGVASPGSSNLGEPAGGVGRASARGPSPVPAGR